MEVEVGSNYVDHRIGSSIILNHTSKLRLSCRGYTEADARRRWDSCGLMSLAQAATDSGAPKAAEPKSKSERCNLMFLLLLKIM